jgi:hypothetical protein
MRKTIAREGVVLAGNPASSQSLEENASSDVTTARILEGSAWASRIMERRREVWIEGMRPRQLGMVRVTSFETPFLVAETGLPESKTKG